MSADVIATVADAHEIGIETTVENNNYNNNSDSNFFKLLYLFLFFVNFFCFFGIYECYKLDEEPKPLFIFFNHFFLLKNNFTKNVILNKNIQLSKAFVFFF